MRTTGVVVLSCVCWLAGCDAYDPPGSASFGACCGGLGTCVPEGIAPDGLSSRLSQGECNEALLCAPSAWVEDPKAVAPACRTAGSREGRCLPACMPDVAAQADGLHRESCDEGLLCVPCFDPLNGQDTQACRLGADSPHEPARLFETCCSERGRCVPSDSLLASIQPQDAQRLGADSCHEDHTLCLPSRWLKDTGPEPETCSTLGEREGRCLPACLPEVARQRGELQQESCSLGDLCVPCFDPVSGEDTKACRIGKDEPARPPSTFERCCGRAGRCVPEEVLLQSLSEQDAQRLGSDVCPEATRCIPEPWLDSTGPRSASCRAPGDVEGRCLLACLPEVAARAGQLQQRECDREQLCVPCYDPLTGADTQACRIAMDRPEQAPRTFADCCDGAGRCVPEQVLLQSLAAEDRARLGADSCKEAALCVPADWLDAERAAVDSCHATGGGEGRCLPSCLPEVAARADQLQQRDCNRAQLCVPCYDPLTGEDTQACRIAMDRPKQAPRTFANCCGGAGRCVPEEALLQSISAEDRARLGAESCDKASLCVPSDWLETGSASAESCQGAGGIEGRCLPSCLPEVAARADKLQQRDCAGEQLCVPCYDPLTGEDTEACRIRDDAPKQRPQTYERCCGSGGQALGTCLPVELLSADQLQSLPVDSCSQPNTRCAPSELLAPAGELRACASPRLFAAPVPGVCLPECFLPPLLSLFTPRADCGAPYRCAPCSTLGGVGCD